MELFTTKSEKTASRHILKSGWLLPATFLICQSTAFAQQPQQQQQQQQQWPPPRRVYNNDNDYVAEHMKQPPDMPYLPPYPNNPEYSNILTWKKTKDGPAHTCTFFVKDTPSMVMDWYKQVLKNNGWQFIPSNMTDRSIAARRANPSAIVTIMILMPVKKGFQSQVYLTYKIFGKE